MSLEKTRLLGELDRLTREEFQEKWGPGADHPHYDSLDLLFYDVFRARGPRGPYEFLRANFSAEAILEGDVVLDIGCGDGFISSRFLAHRAAHVDAIDLEEEAVREAEASNAHPRVLYSACDAVRGTWPRAGYDVIVLDGALGHFSAEDSALLLRRIAERLNEGGVFVGSESLGSWEGHDHLQFFPNLADLASSLRREFALVEVTERTYSIGFGQDRVEGYWRCGGADAVPRLDRLAWKRS